MTALRRTHGGPARRRSVLGSAFALALGLAANGCIRMPRMEEPDAGASRELSNSHEVDGSGTSAGAGEGALDAGWRVAAESWGEPEAVAAFGDTLVVLVFDRNAVAFPARRWSQFVRTETVGALGIYRQRRGAAPDARSLEHVPLRNPSPGWALAAGEHGALAVGYQGLDPAQEFSFRYLAAEPAQDRVWSYRFPPERGAPVRPGLVPMVARAGPAGDAWVVCARVWRGIDPSVRCAAAGVDADAGTLGPWRVIDALAGYDPVGMTRTPEGVFLVGQREAGDAGLWAYRAQRVGADGAAEGAARNLGEMRFSRAVLSTAYGPAVVGMLPDGRAGGLLGSLPPDTLEGAFPPGATGFAVPDGAAVVDGERGTARWLRGGVLSEFRPWPVQVRAEFAGNVPRALASSEGAALLFGAGGSGTRTLLGFRLAE